MDDISSLFHKYKENSKTHKHIIDFSLEQMLIILKTYKNVKIINDIKTFDTTNLESSTKFIILDIVDLN